MMTTSSPIWLRWLMLLVASQKQKESTMKLGVNHVTVTAMQKFESLNVVVRLVETVPGENYYEVYTEPYDLKEQAWREGPWEWLDFPGDQKEYEAQGFRVWKHPETLVYYLWIGGAVFRKSSEITKDYSTNPPTQFSYDVIDYKPEDDSYRDKLLSIMPMAQSMFFQ